MIQPFLVFSDWGILILRLVLGVLMVKHGWPKLNNLPGTAQGFAGMGFRPGIFWATVAGLTEFLGGLALIFGFLTQLAAIFLAVQFLVILLKLKKGKFFVDAAEFDSLIFAAALILITVGGGSFSLDSFLGIFLY